MKSNHARHSSFHHAIATDAGAAQQPSGPGGLIGSRAWLQTVLFRLLAWAAVVSTGLGGTVGVALIQKFSEDAQVLAWDHTDAAPPKDELALAIQATGFVARHPAPVAGKGGARQVGLNEGASSELQTDGIGGSNVGQGMLL